MNAPVWNDRQLQYSALFQSAQALIVCVPCRKSALINIIGTLELSPKVCSVQVTLQIGTSSIYPSIFINLLAKETLPIRAFLTNYFSTLDIRGIVDDQSAALAHGVILGLVERVASECANGTQSTAMIGTHDTLCRIFNHQQPVSLREIQNYVHLASDACIMNGNDNPCSICNSGLDFTLIDIHGIRTNINEY